MELPREHPEHGKNVGLLKRHLYGTLGAADGWQEEYSCSLIELGFRQRLSSACVFNNGERGVVCAVHGDDFTFTGPADQLYEIEKMMRVKCEPKVGGRLGPGPNDDKEATILNRVVRWQE